MRKQRKKKKKIYDKKNKKRKRRTKTTTAKPQMTMTRQLSRREDNKCSTKLTWSLELSAPRIKDSQIQRSLNEVTSIQRT